MEKRDYDRILDSLQTTGIYVIREDSHEILYFNERVRAVAPNIREGMVCHEVWTGTCENCPLSNIGDRQTNHTVNYDDPFGEMVDINATRIMWEEKIPAFVIAVTPHLDAASYAYHKILQGEMNQDVDELEMEELERVRTDRRMAAIIRSSYGVISTVHLDTGRCDRAFLENGEHFREILQGDYSYYIQRALAECVVEEDREQFQEMFSLENLRRNAEQVEEFEERVCLYRIKKDRSIVWAESHIIYIRQKNGVIVNILGRDVTEEKQRAEAVALAEQEKARIINSLSSMFFAVYYIDFEMNTFRMVMQRKEVGSVLGKAADYTEGIRIYARYFVHPDDRQYYLDVMNCEHLKNHLNEKHPFSAIEYRRIKRDQGHEIEADGWIRATVVLAEWENGRPKKALYVAQDISESKQKEAQEQRALKEACDAATHANASKSEFLSRMSHDIRTPMNAIIGMTAIAGTHLEDRERVADCLNKITTASRHLLSLINEVLDMSKIESGKLELAEEEFNLADLVQNLLTMIRPSVQAKGHSLELYLAKVEHEDVIGDVMRLQQVFMNILGNAVKYTPPGGMLELEISERESKTFGYGCYEFVFRDNGIGMKEEFLEQIFDPFSRAEDSRVSKIEGTGLGMAIAQNMIRMMNGTISIKSKEGEGSQFTVTLLLKQQNTREEDLDQFAALPVLVADDDPCACEATCAILNDMGMNGQWVLNGEEAVEKVWEAHCREQDYFAVILDWKMPDMDGIETARRIRKRVGLEVPIIILSAYDWTEVELEARQAGVDEFITKPLFRSRLVYLFKKIAGEENRREKPDLSEKVDDFLKGKRILLAEDNELNREIAEEIIGMTGAVVECVVNGKEAVERFEQRGEGYYDLIFMDIQMPVMNGYEATAAIRGLKQKDGKHIPIIAMTANAFAEDIQASRQAGMNEHVTKPLNIEKLMECLYRWIVVRKTERISPDQDIEKQDMQGRRI